MQKKEILKPLLRAMSNDVYWRVMVFIGIVVLFFMEVFSLGRSAIITLPFLILGILLFEISLIGKDKLDKAAIRAKACYLLLFFIFVSGFFMPTGIIPPAQWAEIKKVQCASNLHQLGIALQQYGLDNNGVFPSTVEQFAGLYGDYIPEGRPKVFLCSGDFNNKWTENEIDNILNTEPDTSNSAQISYTYTPGLSRKSDPSIVILKDNSPLNHLGVGVNILHVDGSISFEPVPGKSWEREMRREWISYLLRYHLCKLIILFLAVFVTIHRIILLIKQKKLNKDKTV